MLTCHVLRNGISNKFHTLIRHQSKTPNVSNIVRRSVAQLARSGRCMVSSQILQKKLPTCHQTQCRCCAHTEVDKGDLEFSEFLKKELELEKERTSPLRPIEGWNVQTKGAEVVLSKSLGNEQIKVTFNVNNMVDASTDFEEQNQEKDPNSNEIMVSKPPFSVEIKKPSGKILSMNCSYPEYEEQEGEFADLFNIMEIAMYDGEWKEETFTVATDTMDEHMYEMLMDMLHDRGIDDKFIQDLTDYSTSFEQDKYVSMLQDLKSFVEEK